MQLGKSPFECMYACLALHQIIILVMEVHSPKAIHVFILIQSKHTVDITIILQYSLPIVGVLYVIR